MQNLRHENEFDVHLSELLSKTDFHMKGFALELVLKQSQRELGDSLLLSTCQTEIPSSTTFTTNVPLFFRREQLFLRI